jgi:hypothetical protein
MSVSRILLVFMRAAAAVQVVLGIGFWSGRWDGLVNVHMAIGALFVISLWIIAGISSARGGPGRLVGLAFVWGVVVLALGMTQRSMLVGDLHWIVRVVHLVVSLASLPIAERLVAAPRAAQRAARVAA